MTARILVALSTFAEHDDAPLALLREAGAEHVLNSLGRRLTRDEIVALGADCAGIIAGVEPYDEEVLEKLPRLKCISRCGVGTDNIALEAADRRGIVVRTTPEVVATPVAEQTIGMILDLLRNLSYYTALMKERRWERVDGRLLAGKLVGVVGLGRVGRRVAEMLTHLGARVCGCDLNPDLAWAQQTEVEVVDIDNLLSRADVVTLHLSALPDAPFCLDERALGRMKRGALLVNTSRGRFVDEAALYRALREKRVGGAALDVFSEEPYSGELCDLDNVVLTPHVSAFTVESRAAMELQATENLLAALSPADTHQRP